MIAVLFHQAERTSNSGYHAGRMRKAQSVVIIRFICPLILTLHRDYPPVSQTISCSHRASMIIIDAASVTDDVCRYTMLVLSSNLESLLELSLKCSSNFPVQNCPASGTQKPPRFPGAPIAELQWRDPGEDSQYPVFQTSLISGTRKGPR